MTGIQASVKDLYFHGSLRVVLKPVLQKLPLVGGVEVTIVFGNLNFHWNEFNSGFSSDLFSGVLPAETSH